MMDHETKAKAFFSLCLYLGWCLMDFATLISHSENERLSFVAQIADDFK
jgi:hypothetical protein